MLLHTSPSLQVVSLWIIRIFPAEGDTLPVDIPMRFQSEASIITAVNIPMRFVLVQESLNSNLQLTILCSLDFQCLFPVRHVSMAIATRSPEGFTTLPLQRQAASRRGSRYSQRCNR